MQNRLTQAFDFQKFVRQPRLAAIIAEVESRYENVLTDDQLEFVNAAGDPNARFSGEDTL